MDETATSTTLPAVRRNRKPPTTARARITRRLYRLNPARTSIARAPLGGPGLMFPKPSRRLGPQTDLVEGIPVTRIPSATIEAERLLLVIIDSAHLIGIAPDGPGGSAEAVLEVRLCRSDLEALVTFGAEHEDAEPDDHAGGGIEDQPHDEETDKGADDDPNDDLCMDLEPDFGGGFLSSPPVLTARFCPVSGLRVKDWTPIRVDAEGSATLPDGGTGRWQPILQVEGAKSDKP